MHFTELKHHFYDTTLNVNVAYAKHAISIDENRKDFARVGWAPTAEKLDKRDASGNLFFEQVWFPGVHADVGGGYEENESRLSDNALAWMLAAASIIPGGLKHDETVLRLHPDPAGPQHDEQKDSWLAFGLRKLPGTEAIMHKSVYRRFAAGPVVLFDTTSKYRPVNMSTSILFNTMIRKSQTPGLPILLKRWRMTSRKSGCAPRGRIQVLSCQQSTAEFGS